METFNQKRFSLSTAFFAYAFMITCVIITNNLSMGNPYRRRPQIISRIVSILGNPASPGEFPYVISLQIYNPSSSSYDPICGGTILTPTTILFAAHCFEKEEPYRIVAGGNDLSRVDGGNVQIRLLENVFIHQYYGGRATYNNDIALGIISSATPLVFTSFVKAINLPSSSEDDNNFTNRFGEVAGWGATSEESTLHSDTLNKVSLQIQGDEICEEFWGEAFTSEKQLCAGSLEGGSDSCFGDSGSPLVVEGEDGDKILVGVTSFSHGCGRKDIPGVYIKVSAYVDWIRFGLEYIDSL